METLQDLLKQQNEIQKKIDNFNKINHLNLNENDKIIYEIYRKDEDLIKFDDFDKWYDYLFKNYILNYKKRKLAASYFENGERTYFFVDKDEYKEKQNAFYNFIMTANNFQRFITLEVSVVEYKSEDYYILENAGATTKNFEILAEKENNIRFYDKNEQTKIINEIMNWKLV